MRAVMVSDYGKEPVVLLIGAGGGVGSFLTQFAARGGAEILARVRRSSAKRVRNYGAAETIDCTTTSVVDAVGHAHPSRRARALEQAGRSCGRKDRHHAMR